MVGCSSNGDESDDLVSASELYDDARDAMRKGSYDRAIVLYRQLQSRFPFGTYAEQAQLDLAYCYHKNFEPDLSVSTLNRFLRTYPTHQHADYAYYLKGLTNFNRGSGFLARLLPQDTIGRDQEFARQSFQDFGELVRRFPDSKYAEDARSRMLYLRDAMAKYEISVAEYYLRRGANVAAANRAKSIVENFQTTAEVAEALAIMAEAYNELEFEALEQDTLRVLELNYPDHPYLTGTRNEPEGWFSRLWPF
jgi:outer membrane protein assembly factor BamD